MKKASIVTIGLTLLLVGFLVFLGNSSEKAPEESMESNYLNEIDQEIAVTDYEGEEVNLSEFKGTPLLVNSWAVWCPFCVEELKDFAKAKRKLQGDLEIIAINRAEPKQKTLDFINNLGVRDDLVFLQDSNDSFYSAIGGFTMPETIFVDSMGEVVFHKRGPMDLVEIKNRISEHFGSNGDFQN